MFLFHRATTKNKYNFGSVICFLNVVTKAGEGFNTLQCILQKNLVFVKFLVVTQFRNNELNSPFSRKNSIFCHNFS